MSDGGYADTINPYHPQTAPHADLRDYAVRMMRWASVIACADATAKTKAANAIDLIISFSSPFFIALSKGTTKQFSDQQKYHHSYAAARVHVRFA